MKKVLILGGVLAVSLIFVVKTNAADTYDIYVDIDNTTGVEDGTETNPYNTIAEAITASESNDKDHRRIYVAEGEYREELDLSDDVELYGTGDDDDQTVLYGKDADGDRFDRVVKMRNNTKLKNLQVRYGDYGVVINDYDEAKIEDCKIKKYKEIGVYVEKGERNDRDLFTMEDTKVYDSDGKGMYIRGRKILLKDNEIYDNDEEGIDLRSKVKGKIKHNEIYDNDESGIEMEVRKANLKITSNDIEDNESSGFTAQYRGKNEEGKITLKRNDFDDNAEYAINCALPAGGNPPINYFSNSIFLITNEYDDNGDGLYSPMCGF